MDMRAFPLVILTPVFEDRAASAQLFAALGARYGKEVFVLVVDDGSVRAPPEPDDLRAAGLCGEILVLRRNIGHQRAIATGLGYLADRLAPDQNVVIMDCDGEDLPDSIAELVAGLDDPEVDAVVAQRTARVETRRFKIFYALYKLLFRLLSGRPIGFGNFMALRASTARRLAAMSETAIHVAGSLIASRLRLEQRPIARGPRYDGQSKMNFVGLVLHGFRGLMVFVEDVLVRLGIACAIIAGLAVSGALAAVGLKLFGFSTPGWFSIALGILVLIFMQTGALSLMTLMLAGVLRGQAVPPAESYQAPIDRVLATHPAVTSAVTPVGKTADGGAGA